MQCTLCPTLPFSLLLRALVSLFKKTTSVPDSTERLLAQSRRLSNLNSLPTGSDGGITATTPPRKAPLVAKAEHRDGSGRSGSGKAFSTRKRPRVYVSTPPPSKTDGGTKTAAKQRRLSKKSHQSQQQASAKGYVLPRTDDADGHLVYCLGDGLCPSDLCPHGRYKILSDLGEGTFGKVVECWDRHEATRVAIKIVRSVSKYRDAAQLEIEVLEHLEANDPGGRYHCVRLLGWFDYEAHVCIVFEKLGPSLYERLRRNRFRPFSLGEVRDIGYQLLESVHFVHSLTLIHTDLKPENILLADSDAVATAASASAASAPVGVIAGVVGEEASAATVPNTNCGASLLEDSSLNAGVSRRVTGAPAGSDTTAPFCNRELRGARNSVTTSATPSHTPPTELTSPGAKLRTAIKLIDFGSATFEAHHHSAVISTRHYRAPEVILGLGWTYPCDLWSIGCILVELYTGQALFQTHENLEHLAMMNTVLGPIPESMIHRADQYSQKYFTAAPKPSSFMPPAPSDRPPSGHFFGRSAATKNHNVAAKPGGHVLRGTAGQSLMPLKVANHRPLAPEAGALSTLSASGSATVPFVEDHQGIDEGISVPPTRTLNWPAGASSVASVKAVRRVKSLSRMVSGSDDHANFLDLLHGLLAFEPDRRCTAADALRHPFFSACEPGELPEGPTVSSGDESSACPSQATVRGGTCVHGVRGQGKGPVGTATNTRDLRVLRTESGAGPADTQRTAFSDFPESGFGDYAGAESGVLPLATFTGLGLPPQGIGICAPARTVLCGGVIGAAKHAPSLFPRNLDFTSYEGFAPETAYAPPTAQAFFPNALGPGFAEDNLSLKHGLEGPVAPHCSRIGLESTSSRQQFADAGDTERAQLLVQPAASFSETDVKYSSFGEMAIVRTTSGALSDVTLVHGGHGVQSLLNPAGAGPESDLPNDRFGLHLN